MFGILAVVSLYSDYALYVFRMLAPICIWAIADVLAIKKTPKFWMTQSFFLYCSQLLVCGLVSKIYIRIMGTGFVSAILAHAIIPIMVLLTLLAPLYILHKVAPKVYAVLSGGRS